MSQLEWIVPFVLFGAEQCRRGALSQNAPHINTAPDPTAQVHARGRRRPGMSTDSTAPGGRQLLPGIPADHHGNGERILHIDDEPSVTTTIRRLLQKLGYNVESFNTPHAATKRFCEAPHEFDLVLTDLMMPGMNGIELASTIRSLRPDLPIILHSAYTDGQDDILIRTSGIREVMSKPADLARIAATIRRGLASSSPNS